MIEFKQIIGRGTRLYDGKDYFTIYDFVKAHHQFSDPEWDGEPIEPEPRPEDKTVPPSPQPADRVREEPVEYVKRKRIKVRNVSMSLGHLPLAFSVEPRLSDP